MMPNAPGYFAHGRHGLLGLYDGSGRFWEPDMFPLYDILDEPPNATEIQQLRSFRNSLPTNTYSGFDAVKGGFCYPDYQGTQHYYKVKLMKHTIQFGQHEYNHYAVVRLPASDTTHTGSYPVVLLLHGRSTVPLTLAGLGGWGEMLSATNDFFTDHCVVVWPLYFGFTFQMPHRYDPFGPTPQYTQACEFNLQSRYIELFEGQDPSTYSTNDPDFQSDYQPKFSANDVQIIAILQSLAAVFGNQQDLELDLSGDVGLVGSSMGCNMLYDIAPILHANSAPGTLKVSVALYGGTDQYAPFNVRRSKRYLASQILRREDMVPADTGASYHRQRFSYQDILQNQIERSTSYGVQLYLWMKDSSLPEPPYVPDPVPSPEVLKASLRRWFLEESVARLWDYPDGLDPGGPWPLQVHHGTADPTVHVDNSRWLAQMMKIRGVPFDSDHFEYYETPFATHKRAELSQTSKTAMATILQAELG